MSTSHDLSRLWNGGREPGRVPPLWVLQALLLVFLVAACEAPDPTGGPEAIVRDSAGVRIVEYPETALELEAPLRLAPEPAVRIGVIEGDDPYQWTRPIAAARLSDGAFIVAEQLPSELRLFDATGAFVRRIGGPGDGPGEFGTLAAVAALPGDTLLTWDSRHRRLSWFTREGSSSREATVRDTGGIQGLAAVGLGPGGGAILLGSTAGFDEIADQGRGRERWELVPVTPEGSAGPSIGSVPGREVMIRIERSGPGPEGIVSIGILRRWWWGEGFAWPSSSGVWTGDRLALEARHFDAARGLDRIVRVLAPERPFTRALIDSVHAAELAGATDDRQRSVLRDDFALREYPEGVPPVDAIFADRAGRLWIGLTDPPRTTLPSGGFPALRRWLLFEEPDDARHPVLLGTIQLPSLSHPVWGDDEGVLLVRNDAEFGVAFVEWYPYLR